MITAFDNWRLQSLRSVPVVSLEKLNLGRAQDKMSSTPVFHDVNKKGRQIYLRPYLLGDVPTGI